MPTRPKLLVEPFVGGGIISLTALFENLVDTAVMVEKDVAIAAVWQAVVAGHADWLAEQILSFELSRESVIAEISRKYTDKKHIAFQTMLKNRTFHGGILAEGAGFLKNGENGKGILSRWYPTTLARRFHDLNIVADRIEFICGDGLEVLRKYAHRTDAVFFIDPPYTAGGKKAGKRLYTHFDLDHVMLFDICANLAGDFIITYDNAEEVRELARTHSFEMRLIAMKNTHHAEMTELVIGRDLSWMDDAPCIRERGATYSAAKKRNAAAKSPGRKARKR